MREFAPPPPRPTFLGPIVVAWSTTKETSVRAEKRRKGALERSRRWETFVGTKCFLAGAVFATEESDVKS